MPKSVASIIPRPAYMEGSSMGTVLVCSSDSRFLQSCESELKAEGYVPYMVTSELGLVDFFKASSEVDVVIINGKSEGRDCRQLLEFLHQMRPHPSVILTSSYFNFWNDFSTWLADACVVTSSDLTELKDAVKNLMVAERVSRNPGDDKSRFSVDWA